jgi:hypothetical protein
MKSNKMKRLYLIPIICLGLTLIPSTQASAQIEIIGEVIKQVIMAIDLGVQKVQTQTIILQDVQKQVENAMQESQLGDIINWVQQQKDLYSEYYQELWEAKNVIVYYDKVKDIIQMQAQLVSSYKKAYSSIRQDTHFSTDEVNYMYTVYSGILDRSLSNITELTRIIQSFITQMDDGDRLHIIDVLSAGMDQDYNDLQSFTQHNILLSLQRSKDQQDLDYIKSLYGIP